MHVIDSSTWIYGITGNCRPAVSLLDEVIYGDRIQIAVDGYIVTEVMDGLERTHSDHRKIEQAQQRFSEIVHGNRSIRSPTVEEVRRVDLEQVRNSPNVQMIAQTYGIQPKDVPIVTCAFQYGRENSVIYTSDEEFSTFDPPRYGLDQLRVEYVDCSDV